MMEIYSIFLISNFSCKTTQGATLLFKISQYVEEATMFEPRFRADYFENINSVCKATLSNDEAVQRYQPKEEAKSLHIKKYECMAYYLGQVSRTYGLDDIWYFNQEELQRFIEYREACLENDSEMEEMYVETLNSWKYIFSKEFQFLILNLYGQLQRYSRIQSTIQNGTIYRRSHFIRASIPWRIFSAYQQCM